MIIKQAEFTISAVSPKQYPEDGAPEIALAGRSNVGKSSLINKFINRKNLARTSSRPGKTQTLNFYKINNGEFFFVDLPGYGFAKVSHEVKEKWSQFIEAYLSKRDNLKGVIQVVDLRHPPSKDDVMMYMWLTHLNLDVLVVATKADKISKGQYQKHLKQIRDGLKTVKGQQIVTFSAETGLGLDEVRQWVDQYLPKAEQE